MRPLISARARRDVGALMLVVGVALALSYTEFHDGDLGFHLATGREILATGRIPQTNVLSFTNATYPWLLHQWLPGVLFELAQREAGVGALQALKMALVAASWLAVYAGTRALTESAVAAALATVLGATAAAFRYELRPYLFTHLALAASVAAAAWYVRAAERDSRIARRALVLIAIVPVIACHFHAGVVDSWLVMLALMAGSLAEPLRARLAGVEALPPSGPRAAASILAAVAASLALAALSLALYHPIGWRVLVVPFDMGTDRYLAEHLVEFRPPTSFPVLALGAYWLFVVLVLATLVWRWRKVHTFWLFVIAGFLLLSLRHVRLVFGFAIVASPVMALGVEGLFAKLRTSLRLSLVMACLIASVLHCYALAPPGTGFARETFPPYLFEYLEKHRLQGQAYVSDAWAAPLLGRTYPQRKAFFDNRFDAYPRSFFLDVYQHIRYGRQGWDALLERYGVDLVLMRYTTAGEFRFQSGRPNVRQLLARDPRWSLVTFDDLGMLFVRRAGVDGGHARRWSLPHLDPDNMMFLAPPRETADALRQEVARGNHAARVLLFAAYAELDHGNHAAAKALLARVPNSEEAQIASRQLVRHLRKW